MDNGGNVEIPERHLKCYIRANEKNSFGSQTVGEIEYIAFDGRFYDVSISSLEPYALSTIFSQNYGPLESSKSGDSRYWNWKSDDDQVEASMCYSPPSDLLPNGLTWAHITCKKLEDELQSVRKFEASQVLSKAKKDF